MAAILDVLLMQENLYFCMALVGHMLLLYLIYRISASYEIILLPDRVIRKTILGTQEFPLQETVFLGIGTDAKHPYRLPATHYQNRRLIRLSYNDEIICFNPNIFYNPSSPFCWKNVCVNQKRVKSAISSSYGRFAIFL